jgi:uncharacterized protein (TIGR02996 family)
MGARTDRYELGFQKAIAAEPQDDTPRLVFADFLDERGEDGDREMAAFIRAEVELARTDEADPTYPERLARARRSGVFTRKDRRPWLDSVPGAMVTFRRGLIAGVTLPADVHRKHDVADWERIPVEQLSWLPEKYGGADGWNKALGTALAARPELERLSTLVSLGGPAFLGPLLSGCPRLAGLRSLSIGNWGYDEPADPLVALAERMNLPALDSLRLLESRWPPAGWQPFVQAAGRRLRRLRLEAMAGSADWYEQYDTDWLEQLAKWPLASGVAWLDLSDRHSFGETDPVWSVGDPKTAERAALKGPEFGEQVELSGWPALRRLHIEMGNESQGTGELSHLKSASKLEWFSSNDINFDEEARRFAAGKQLQNLRRLSLHTSNTVILQGEYCQRLLRLEWGNDYDKSDTTALLAARLPELRWLTLRGCGKAEILAPLPGAANMPNLCTLLLADAPRDANQARKLVGRLAKAPGLPHLSLVGVGWSFERKWWVLGEGKAVPVSRDVDPVWRDRWEFDPTDDWF